jgi:hypothetical protein
MYFIKHTMFKTLVNQENLKISECVAFDFH